VLARACGTNSQRQYIRIRKMSESWKLWSNRNRFVLSTNAVKYTVHYSQLISRELLSLRRTMVRHARKVACNLRRRRLLSISIFSSHPLPNRKFGSKLDFHALRNYYIIDHWLLLLNPRTSRLNIKEYFLETLF